MNQRLHALFIAAATVGLSLPGCGGGGGPTSEPSSPPAACTDAAPLLTIQPAAAAVTEGQAATFAATATGSHLSYQWLREGVAIGGATAASYTTAATSAADSGAHFSVRVSNCAAPVTSTVVTLTVSPATTGSAPQPARISAGPYYSLALRADGRVLTWGSGMVGGTGTQIAGTAASVLNGISGVGAVLADGETGTPNSIAIGSNGQVYAWGYSNANAAIINAPTLQAALSPAVSIARCTEQNLINTPYLVLRANGTLWLGGTQQVAGLSSVVAITKHSELPGAGCRPLAVKSDGSLWAVGFSYGSTAVQLTQIAGLPAVSAVSCAGGFGHNCLALSTDGHVWAWGDNKYGQLGDGTLTARTIPYQIAGLSNIRQIDIATQGAAAITGDKRLYTWGGATGRPSTEDFRLPGLIDGWSDVESVSVGYSHWLVLRTDGSVWGWGDNSQGQLGDGTAGNVRQTPVQVIGVNLN